ncbi:hypothetical protein [Kribbella sp. NPDC050470]|uniref:hypothetical protein n=1 Tax=unclassified Kribbella TaxID=2644121 RepID=UPI00379FFEE0
MAGQILGFLWTVGALFFLLSAFVFPVVFVRWKRREKADAEATEKALERCKADTTNLHIFDGA